MKKQFEEISSMLDNVKGGQAGSGLFDGTTEPQGTRICSDNCTDDCKENSIGTSTGTNKGLNFPDKPIIPFQPVKP